MSSAHLVDSSRHTPVVIVASADASRAERLASQLRAEGRVAYATHSAGGCLRVATVVGPDLVLLDPAMPGRVAGLLKAHPATAHTAVMRLADDRQHLASAFHRPAAWFARPRFAFN